MNKIASSSHVYIKPGTSKLHRRGRNIHDVGRVFFR